jgi:hypothetical protein
METGETVVAADDQTNVTIDLTHDDKKTNVDAASPGVESTLHEVQKRSGRAGAHKQFLALLIRQTILQWRMRWTNVFIILGMEQIYCKFLIPVVPIIMICLAGIMQAVANSLIPTITTFNVEAGPLPINYYPASLGTQNSTYV